MERDKLIKPDGRFIPYIRNVRTQHHMILLCLHGFAGDKDSSVIAALMDSLDNKGMGVFTFDWPAHGESEDPDNYLTVENCLSDLDYVVKTIRQMTGKPLSCFATSFGGYLATLYRNEHPDVFRHMVLRSPALKMAEIFRRLISEEDLAKIMMGQEIIQGFERKMSLGKAFYESLCRHDAYSVIPPNPEDILILQGDKDTVVDPEDTFSYAQKYGIRTEVFKGTDHIYKRPGEKERIVEVSEKFLLHRF